MAKRMAAAGWIVLLIAGTALGEGPGAGAAGAAAAGPPVWHNRLYLANGGYWQRRVAVLVRNDRDSPAVGEPVAVGVGKDAGQADLVDAMAQAVRVCDPDGVEMLFSINRPDGTRVISGPVPAGSTLTIPVECPGKSSTTCYVYFGNPQAWAVPDFLEARAGVVNGGMEEGAGEAPALWHHDKSDDRHKASWVAEDPHSGRRCLKTVVVEKAEPTWISTRRHGILILGGAKYTMSAWVKADNVKGYAGWYIHLVNGENRAIANQMLSGGEGTYGWKKVTAEFTAPKDASAADLGTVLWGTGTAWFDDVTLECSDGPKLAVMPARPEQMPFAQTGGDAKWYDGDGAIWNYRTAVRAINRSAEAADKSLVCVDLSLVRFRLRDKAGRLAFRATTQDKLISHHVLENLLLFENRLPPRTIGTSHIYIAGDAPASAPGLDYAALVAGSSNLVRNPSFEQGEKLPTDWLGGVQSPKPGEPQVELDSPGYASQRCARIHIPPQAGKAWTGWRQDVAVKPSETYLYAAWVKCKDVKDGSVQLHVHYHDARGQLCRGRQMASVGAPLAGTTDWTLLAGLCETPPDVATCQLCLTTQASGTVWHDAVVLARVEPADAGPLERRAPKAAAPLAVWPVNALVKVFQDDVPPAKVLPARISAARNEKEPLQLALRSAGPVAQVSVQVDPPAHATGSKLTDLSTAVVGYVPIDHKTNYYNSTSPRWHRKFPTAAGACDGWAGMWPDPLLPRSTFDLAAETTQSVWITLAVPKDAPAGDYSGKVTFTGEGRAIAEVPFTVHVWDFALADETHVKAVYDLRIGQRWELPPKSDQEVWRQLCRFMAERRVCPDTIRPEPIIRYDNGKVTADFTEFDKAADFYFNTLKFPHAYTPWQFYLFGWGFPPGEKFGQKPYEGEFPFDKADRGTLRAEFKKAYQACLKAYWDHLKEKGWHKKCLMYISDEPFYSNPAVREQMKALCRMIHEVDPAIPIYCSTWRHVPEWDAHLNVWGIGHHGPVAAEKIAQLRAGGARILWTTDGQMCTDTPYCAVERLLPHYCFKYGAEGYEFWGITWLTYDPYQFGWHAYIHQSDTPGKSYYVRYPNGDGFLAYPGGPVGHDGPVSSIRLEQAREGVEDYEYLYLLADLTAKARAAGKDVAQAQKALELAARLVDIPNAGGRHSTKILPNPDAVFDVKEALAGAIEALGK